jgi:hypothetical protein
MSLRVLAASANRLPDPQKQNEMFGRIEHLSMRWTRVIGLEFKQAARNMNGSIELASLFEFLLLTQIHERRRSE